MEAIFGTKGAAQESLVQHSDAPRDLLEFVRNHIARNWTEFIESFGIRYPGVKKRRDWTKKKIVSEIGAWQAQGHSLNYRAIKNDNQALLYQARKFFGSWDQALTAAETSRRRIDAHSSAGKVKASHERIPTRQS